MGEAGRRARTAVLLGLPLLGAGCTAEGLGKLLPDDTGPSVDDSVASDDTGPVSYTGRVYVETSKGSFTILLYEDLAPVTTENFLGYVDDGFYDGDDGLGATIFHRVVPGFVVQAGGHLEDLSAKETRDPIVNEADNGVSNLRGTVAMARTSAPDSATSQFYVNLVDNGALDYKDEGDQGYAVFGEVEVGLDVIDAMAAVETTTVSPYSNVPVEPIVINDCERR